jgi:hypothetical protein
MCEMKALSKVQILVFFTGVFFSDHGSIGNHKNNFYERRFQV